METNKIRCTCVCHSGLAGSTFMHMQACCDNGWITIPVVDNTVYVKDTDYLRFHEENGETWTYQHNELFDGKIKVNSEWEVLEEEIGTVYVVKPKKDEA